MRSTLIACCIALAACTADRALAQIAFVTNARGTTEIAVTEGPGGAYRIVLEAPKGAGAPSWSPDATWLTYTARLAGAIDVYTMSSDGARVDRLTNEATQDAESAWSPDGSRIAFSSDRGGNWDVYVMSVDGGSVEQLTNDPGTDWCPTWSPDGERIVFTSQRTGRSSLHVLDLDGGDAQFVGGAPYACEDPSWSPDGEWIAFRGALGTAYDICVVNVHGGMPRAVSTHTARDHEPAWSPDGSELAFASDRDGALAVYVMDAVDGSNVRRVTPEGIEAWSPAWARPPMPDEPRAVRAQDRRLVTRGAMRAQRPNQRHE